MPLTKDQVKHVAKLANLSLTSEEEDSPRFASEAGKYSEQLSKILDYIEQLNQVDTSNVEPTFNVSSQTNVEAKDEIGDYTLSQENASSNAPKEINGFFVTKGVLEKE